MLKNLKLENFAFFFGSISNKLVLGCLACFGGY